MKISYDPEIDALYIRLLDGKHECRSSPLLVQDKPAKKYKA